MEVRTSFWGQRPAHDSDLFFDDDDNFELVHNAQIVSPGSRDIKDIGVSGANHESREVYLHTFTRQMILRNGILRYPPRTVAWFEEFPTPDQLENIDLQEAAGVIVLL